MIPLDFLNQTIEEVYNANEGLIWLIGIILGVVLFVITFINGIVQRELNEAAAENKLKSELITKQNDKIIANQESYITEIRILSEEIIKNNKHDLEALENIHAQNEKIETLLKRVERAERGINKINTIDKRLLSIEKLIKLHDKDINILKKTG
jgi:pyridoxal/pyridoxine/pyridoxamine kinase